jgi:spore coat protein U-like protein
MRNVVRAALALCLLGFGLTPAAVAGTLVGQLQISAVVEPTCSIDSVGSIYLGVYLPLAGNTQNHTFRINCDGVVNNAAISFSSASVDPSNSQRWRLDGPGSATLAYDITDVGTGTLLSDGVAVPMDVLATAAPAAEKALMFKLPAGQTPTANGIYSDTMVVTYQFN